MPHKFKCHDSVLLNPAIGFARPKGDLALVFEIVRLMPPDDRGENGYRIRAGNAERAVGESEIRSV